MRLRLWAATLGLTIASLATTVHPSSVAPGAAPAATDLLDQYLNGEFDAVVATLAGFEDLGDFAADLTAQASPWIAAGPVEARERRTLTAATVAMEASRVGQWTAWKLVRRLEVVETNFAVVYFLTYWEPPARLLEWGCELLRQTPTPTAAERLWQLASIAVAERAEDFEFLVGHTNPPRFHYPAPPVQHAVHLQARFPDEMRIKLALGIAVEDHDRQQAEKIFRELEDDVDVGGEATVRLGSLALRRGRVDEALPHFARVESKTRDPWVLYLARFLSGRAHELRRRPADAEKDYRRALRVIPDAQSGTAALAALLFRDGRRAEASDITATALVDGRNVADPWRGYGDADDRFWPELIRRVRAEIHP
jgi:tetratricopeptide (TPR) repeat protein